MHERVLCRETLGEYRNTEIHLLSFTASYCNASITRRRQCGANVVLGTPIYIPSLTIAIRHALILLRVIVIYNYVIYMYVASANVRCVAARKRISNNRESVVSVTRNAPISKRLPGRAGTIMCNGYMRNIIQPSNPIEIKKLINSTAEILLIRHRLRSVTCYIRRIAWAITQQWT